jgi:thiol-disulfide isomerase/thioredoxin
MKRLIPVTVLLGVVTAVLAQTSPPAATPTPAPARPSMDDLRFLRMKISAGDLPSAESIMEVHRAEKGEDAEYVYCLAWLARGAALLDDWTAAARYAKAARAAAVSRLGTPPDWEKGSESAYALGTAIEVEAQALLAAGKRAEALRFLDVSAREQEKAPYNLRARIQKRRNQIELVGRAAPAIAAEDRLGTDSPSLESLRGKPVVLYFWWEACGDCKAQAAAFRRTVEKYSPRGVAFLAPTRFYGDAGERSEEKAKIEKSWSELYGLAGTVPVPIGDAAMLRYGASATPTFAFVDRQGIVREYLPYRMTEERLSAEIEELLR